MSDQTKAILKRSMVMAFPNTEKGLNEAGYTFKEEKQCRLCNQTIRMWQTPAGRQMPMDAPDETGTVITHFATCAEKSKFARDRKLRP
jgi:hypothetical protein